MAAISITDEAVEAILGIRDREPDAEELALTLEITGIRGLNFIYEMTFIPVIDAADDDVVQHFGSLPVVVKAGSAKNLDGATIAVVDGGLAIDNPNSPSPAIDIAGGAALDGPVAQRVEALLQQNINPAIASHGGWAELAGVDGSVAYLKLGGGCQGCGMAQVTLRQGIERTILENVPEITSVVDVTDHASGENPYYEASAK